MSPAPFLFPQPLPLFLAPSVLLWPHDKSPGDHSFALRTPLLQAAQWAQDSGPGDFRLVALKQSPFSESYLLLFCPGGSRMSLSTSPTFLVKSLWVRVGTACGPATSFSALSFASLFFLSQS